MTESPRESSDDIDGGRNKGSTSYGDTDRALGSGRHIGFPGYHMTTCPIVFTSESKSLRVAVARARVRFTLTLNIVWLW